MWQVITKLLLSAKQVFKGLGQSWPQFCNGNIGLELNMPAAKGDNLCCKVKVGQIKLKIWKFE